ncbi:MAG: serine/threonine-protein kinase [Terrimicrobiaceae bacterium]|nr:serine/threonine-protein kinase [Terrimicrobiaceae bacterium]
MSVYLDIGKRYELGGLLGRGGLGEVLLATDLQLDRRVAIKRLFSNPDRSEETAAAAIREARSLASLLHPNVVTVFDIVDFLGDILVIMEYVPGRTLQEICDHAPLRCDDFLTVARGSLAGIEAVHDAGMLHLDVKPGNIMVSAGKQDTWKVKVLDFGLAQLLQTGLGTTTDGEPREVLGSIYTMAPEQLEGLPVGEWTDLYSLGCVFYFTLAGSYPFTGASVDDVIAAHLEQRLTPLDAIRPDLPSEVTQWVMGFLAVQPADRFHSAGEALQRLPGG